jgi:hypothetical protein
MSIPGIAEGFTHQGEYKPENLIAGQFPRISRIVTVTGGAVLPQGAVLGRIAANGFYQLSDAGNQDGSEMPDAILAEPVDATGGDVQAHAYFAGEFNARALSLGAGHTLESVVTGFRRRSIFLRNNQA